MNPRAALAALLVTLLALPAGRASGSLCARTCGCMKQPDCEDEYCPGRAEAVDRERAAARQSLEVHGDLRC